MIFNEGRSVAFRWIHLALFRFFLSFFCQMEEFIKSVGLTSGSFVHLSSGYISISFYVSFFFCAFIRRLFFFDERISKATDYPNFNQVFRICCLCSKITVQIQSHEHIVISFVRFSISFFIPFISFCLFHFVCFSTYLVPF